MGITYINADNSIIVKIMQIKPSRWCCARRYGYYTCGSKLVLRDFTNRDDLVEAYFLDQILYDMELNYDEFVDLCILLGNDYNYRPRGYNPDQLLKLILRYRSIEIILKKKIINWNCDYKKIRNIIKLNNINIQKELNNENSNISIEKIKDFLKKNSNIDERTYIHRINLIYSPKKFF